MAIMLGSSAICSIGEGRVSDVFWGGVQRTESDGSVPPKGEDQRRAARRVSVAVCGRNGPWGALCMHWRQPAGGGPRDMVNNPGVGPGQTWVQRRVEMKGTQGLDPYGRLNARELSASVRPGACGAVEGTIFFPLPQSDEVAEKACTPRAQVVVTVRCGCTSSQPSVKVPGVSDGWFRFEGVRCLPSRV
ncbi:predicted protein [Verticillium alfalfae VaMs.102]|uniref:Predicted protein n=1 Tax=Verticillium alfalfae (strain VaMs.102 / ATCC MYA-4576 / FGSC 10136) TaxID=526221 RepID=C9SQJ3_VERA1|nr:predicted protein [Verticillium alfalfae VaMs.102]EEY21118.1 predicted protein [Verticillium alfalfae VaMs.102]